LRRFAPESSVYNEKSLLPANAGSRLFLVLTENRRDGPLPVLVAHFTYILPVLFFRAIDGLFHLRYNSLETGKLHPPEGGSYEIPESVFHHPNSPFHADCAWRL
jgi:hypothetical protein